MIRLTTIILCLLLAAAAAGRYRAEESVRKARAELEALDARALEEARAIQTLRAEIAYLENPARLAAVARQRTDLRPSDRAQLVAAPEFAKVFGSEADDAAERDAAPRKGVPASAVAVALNADAE